LENFSMQLKSIGLILTLGCLVLAPIANAQGRPADPPGNSGGGGNPGNTDTPGDLVTVTVETTVTTVSEPSVSSFMGMSQVAPPNENAADSQGVRTETSITTTVENVTTEVSGPKGQIDNENYDCSNCTSTEISRDLVSSETETSISGPGNSNN
jgi:hypothetical protein